MYNAAINTGVADVGGRTQCTAQHPAGRRAVHLFIGRSPEAYRTAPGRHPYGLLNGRLAITLHQFLPDTARAP